MWDVRILFWAAMAISSILSLLYPAFSGKWIACSAVTLAALFALTEAEK
jgi:hypothetical protein